MALLLAESLVEQGDFDANTVAERWVRWMKRDGRGIGPTTQRALRLIERGTEPFEAGRLARSAGAAASNGAVMRCIPVALRYHDNVDKLVRVSTQQAAITHADERCTWGAAAVNLAARELLHGNAYFVEEVLHRVEGAAPRPLIEAIRRVPWEQRSEERRVGKECRARWSRSHAKKKSRASASSRKRQEDLRPSYHGVRSGDRR